MDNVQPVLYKALLIRDSIPLSGKRAKRVVLYTKISARPTLGVRGRAPREYLDRLLCSHWFSVVFIAFPGKFERWGLENGDHYSIGAGAA
jgi:hypothetical protein